MRPTVITPTRPGPSSVCSTTRLDLPHTRGLTLTDQWLDLAVELAWSQSASLWCFPIETVSQSDGGVEGVYQSSAVIPHWHVTPTNKAAGTSWIRWSLDRATAVNPAEKRELHVATSTYRRYN